MLACMTVQCKECDVPCLRSSSGNDARLDRHVVQGEECIVRDLGAPSTVAVREQARLDAIMPVAAAPCGDEQMATVLH